MQDAASCSQLRRRKSASKMTVQVCNGSSATHRHQGRVWPLLPDKRPSGLGISEPLPKYTPSRTVLPSEHRTVTVSDSGDVWPAGADRLVWSRQLRGYHRGLLLSLALLFKCLLSALVSTKFHYRFCTTKQFSMPLAPDIE